MVFQANVKVFEIVQRHYAALGIRPTNHSSAKCPINKRVLTTISFLLCSIVLHAVYMFQMAAGFMEFVECICTTYASCMITGCFTIIVLQKDSLFESIGNLEKLIDTREALFDRANWNFIGIFVLNSSNSLGLGCAHPKSRRFLLLVRQQVEQLSEIVFTAMLKVALQCFILPPCVVSFGVYIFTDAGTEAFQLPLPMWWIPMDCHSIYFHNNLFGFSSGIR